ncbi:MraY family glycosyltransferase [Treponema sp.]
MDVQMIVAFTSLSAFLLSALLVALVLLVSKRYAWFDQHDERKIHSGQVPRLGGIGFAIAYILVVGLATLLYPPLSYGLRFIPVLVAMPLILVFGIVDDFKTLRPRYKLLSQIIGAVLVISAGYTFDRLSFAPLGIDISFGLLAYPLTLLWIVGITNAVNLIDGVDGLAGGVSALAALGYAAIFISTGNERAALLCFALAAAIGGFLVFNLPLPNARIFMGDGGSQFLGFMLALLPLLDNGRGGMNLQLPYAAALLLIPIFDTFAAIWRRTRDGRRIDSPDKAHMHHKLMVLGFGSRGVDLIVYGLQIIVGVLVFFAFKGNGTGRLFFLLGAYGLAGSFFITIHYLNRAANKKAETQGV